MALSMHAISESSLPVFMMDILMNYVLSLPNLRFRKRLDLTDYGNVLYLIGRMKAAGVYESYTEKGLSYE